MTRPVLAVIAALALAACGGAEGPTLDVGNVRIFAPVPGSDAGVAYMTVTNRGDEPVTIRAARSAEFGAIAIHESFLDDGIARMRPLETVMITPGGSTEFTEGGAHFMLGGARPGVVAGSTVTIEILHDRGLLVVSAALQDRLAAR